MLQPRLITCWLIRQMAPIHTSPGNSVPLGPLGAFAGRLLIFDIIGVVTNALPSLPPDTSQLTRVTLISAAISDELSGPHASWVESCTCPPGFAGQFCEQCAPGFTRQDPGGGPLSPCVPCNCHQHGSCHQETGSI